jgi:penicillin G amidase
MVGASIPGVPLITIGRTKYISWGMTSSMVDTSDLYRETLNEE